MSLRTLHFLSFWRKRAKNLIILLRVNFVKQSHEIATSLRPVHHAVQGFAPRNDYFIKPFTIRAAVISKEKYFQLLDKK